MARKKLNRREDRTEIQPNPTPAGAARPGAQPGLAGSKPGKPGEIYGAGK